MIEKKLIMTTNRVVIFEGTNRSGKTALRLELLKVIPNLLTIDRFTPSNYVYSMLFNREEDFAYLAYLEYILSTRSIIVYCYTDYPTYIERCKNTGHEVQSEFNFNTEKLFYDQYFKDVTLFKNIIKFDTGKMTTESCLKILLPYIHGAPLS